MAKPDRIHVLCKENDVAKFLNFDFTPGTVYPAIPGRPEHVPGGNYAPLAVLKDNKGWWFQLQQYHVELGLFEIVEGEGEP